MKLRSGKVYTVATKKARQPRKLAKPAKKAVVKLIKKEMAKKIELKYLDTAITGTIDATAELFPSNESLLQIGTGDSVFSKDGSSIRVKSISIKGSIVRTATALQLKDGIIRIAIVCFKHCDGGLPVLADIWDQVADIGTAHREFDTTADYNVLGMISLYDKPVHLNFVDATSSTVTKTQRDFSWSHSWKNGLPVKFNDTTTSGVYTGTEENNIFLIAQSIGADNDDEYSFLNTVCRVRFTN